MPADTGKKSNLALHLDKISYGAAGVIALLVLLVPLLAKQDVVNLVRGADEARNKVEERQRIDIPPPVDVPQLGQIIEAQWGIQEAAATGWISPWSAEARPAILKLVKETVLGPAEHQPGAITRITYHRDAARMEPYLKVEATRGKLMRCKFTRTRLLRAEVGPGGPGEFQDVGSPFSTDAIVYEDRKVQSGKAYAYRLDTEVAVEGDPKQIELAPTEAKKESPVLAMPLKAPVPFDYALRILFITPHDANSSPPVEAAFNGTTVSWWDYAAGKVDKKDGATWNEGNSFGPKLRDGTLRFKIQRIDAGAVKIIDHAKLRDREATLTPQQADRPVDLPAEWTPEKAATAAASAADEKDEEPKQAAPPKRPAPTKEKTEKDKKDTKKGKDKKPKDKDTKDKKK